MAWFKVDDRLPMSAKVMSIPRADRAAAIGLWTLAGAWSSAQLTDGLVPAFMLEAFCADEALAACLVDAGLWQAVEGGWQFHDWDDYQPSREDVEAKRAARSEAGRKGGVRSGAARRGEANAKQTGSKTEAVASTSGSKPEPRPVPARPVPDPLTPPNGGVAAPKRGTRIPEPFEVTAEMVAWARERCPLVDGQRATERFVNYFAAKTGRDATKLDWLKTWKNWLLSDQEKAERSRPAGKLTPMERAQRTAEAGRMVAGMQITSLEVEA